MFSACKIDKMYPQDDAAIMHIIYKYSSTHNLISAGDKTLSKHPAESHSANKTRGGQVKTEISSRNISACC